MTERALVVEGLSVEVRRDGGWHPAVADVDLEIDAGRLLAVVGETGAGKTLTSKAITGLPPRGVRVVSGTAWLGGSGPLHLFEPGSMSAFLGTDVGTVLQNPAGMFDPVLRVGRQLLEAPLRSGAMTRGEADERARELLSGMGFADPEPVMRRYPHQLSGGMAQRAAIAMTLMTRPRLLVVDEPTSALDPHLRAEVLNLIAALARRHETAVLLISHDLALVGQVCDEVAVMYAGRIVERGSIEQVLEHPEHPYTRRLLATTTSLASTPRMPLSVIPGAPPQPGMWPPGCPFSARCDLAFDRCLRDRPSLLGPAGHDVACHLAFEPDVHLPARNGESLASA